MFTGLIEDVGRLVMRQAQGKAGKLAVSTHLPVAEVTVGDSIAVNGACLTVERIDGAAGILGFHTLTETLRRTNLGSRPIGSPVNLERAMPAQARFGGHLVQGHVDTTAPLLGIDRRDDDYVVSVALPEDLRALVIPKGSIAIDGISLTVAELHDDCFTVHIIPHTWARTALHGLRAGDRVNLESDLIGKYVLRQMQHLRRGADVTLDRLAEAGFL